MAEAQKLKIFISYSRDDLAFADQLYLMLEATGFEPTLDRVGISGAENWRQTLSSMIRKSDTVVFVLSPSSAASPRCAEEVEIADGLGKRIVPIVCRPLEGENVPRRLQDLNYIFFYPEPKAPGSGFGGGAKKLKVALETDLGWMRDHTRLTDRAMEWDSAARIPERLLSGSDIEKARAWMLAKPRYAPDPTALQRTYIDASASFEAERSAAQAAREAAARDGEVKRLEAEKEAQRLRLETGKLEAERVLAIAESRRRRSQLMMSASLAALLAALVVIGGPGLMLYTQAQERRHEAEARAMIAQTRAKEAEAQKQLAETKSRLLESEKKQAELAAQFEKDKSVAVASAPPKQPTQPPTPLIGKVRSLPEDLVLKLVSKDAIDLIVAFEVSGPKGYETKYTHPALPPSPAGITIGMGYDLGYASSDEFESDWKAHLQPAQFELLKGGIGLKDAAALAYLERVRDISVPFDAAMAVFQAKTLTRCAAAMESVFPNARELPPDAYGALVSLTYNRGASLNGERRIEMRNIRDLMEKRDFAAVPNELRKMKRLWPEITGMRVRRDAEATLFEKGLASRAVEAARAMLPPT